MRLLPIAAVLAILPPVLQAQAPAPVRPPSTAEPAPHALPVRRVVLYKTGVGYLEHVGQVRDRQDVAIRFTSAQLNDVLKSLTAIDLGQGRISGISFDSVAPIEQRLAALRLPLGMTTTSAGMLEALRGARVEVTTGTGTVSGRLLGIEQTPRGSGADRIVQTGFTIVTDTGDMRSYDLGPGVNVRVAERELRQDIARYLDVVSSTRDRDARTMVVSAEGTGPRSLFVSYVSEVPIWKSTYRLVLPSGTGKPLLQGWAIVDNTIGEDWTNVELSLVAGAPQSFIQDISRPYYGRRPVVPLQGVTQTAPQTHDATLLRGATGIAGVVRDQAGSPLPGVTVRVTPQEDAAGGRPAMLTTDAGGRFQASLPEGTYRIDASLPGFRPAAADGVVVSSDRVTGQDLRMDVGTMTESVSVLGAPKTGRASGVPGGVVGGVVGGVPAPPPAPVVDIYGQVSNQRADATAAALGDLFEYKLDRPVTLAKDQSALVPIVNAPVAVEKVALWNTASGNGRPLRAVWLHNTSGLTLDGGSITVVDGNAFAGEGLVQPLKPGSDG